MVEHGYTGIVATISHARAHRCFPQEESTIERIGASRIPVAAVVVENSTDARPQKGVDSAFVVYEAPVEGNITRWLALFDARDTAKPVDAIGPVRSARPVFLELAAPWQPLFTHVGGSPEVLERLKRLEGIQDWDEFFHAGSFWRAKEREAPHNAYTALDRLQKAIVTMDVEKIWDTPRRVFADSATAVAPMQPFTLSVPFGHAAYDVEWRWNGDAGVYERYQQGQAARMKNGTPLVATSVAILYTSIATVDDVGRKRITLTGSGNGLWCTAAGCQDARWQKASAQEPLLFLNPRTKERLTEEANAGTLWVEIVDRNHVATVSAQ